MAKRIETRTHFIARALELTGAESLSAVYIRLRLKLGPAALTAELVTLPTPGEKQVTLLGVERNFPPRQREPAPPGSFAESYPSVYQMGDIFAHAKAMQEGFEAEGFKVDFEVVRTPQRRPLFSPPLLGAAGAGYGLTKRGRRKE